MSDKMVSIAHVLGKALGSNSQKYERAMAERLERELQDTLPLDVSEEGQDNSEPDASWFDQYDLDAGVKPIKRSRRREDRKKDKERTLQRKKQRERKFSDWEE